jgi:hypothetical protein
MAAGSCAPSCAARSFIPLAHGVLLRALTRFLCSLSLSLSRTHARPASAPAPACPCLLAPTCLPASGHGPVPLAGLPRGLCLLWLQLAHVHLPALLLRVPR